MADDQGGTMTATDSILDGFTSMVFISAQSDGITWFGTHYWMVRDSEQRRPDARAMDRLASIKPVHELVSVESPGGGRMLDRKVDGSVFRIYRRPDDEIVLLNDAYVRTIEGMALTVEPEFDDDEYDGDAPTICDYRLKQGDKPLDPVAVMVGQDFDQVAAVLVPCRFAN